MDSIDLEVLKTCAAWLAAGHRCELVTVIKTWGSSPRPIGATLAICDDGVVVGSALVERIRLSLDAQGKATEKTVSAVTSLVAELAAGVRQAAKAAA